MLTLFRVLVAVVVGAVGCLFVWTAAPLNNFLLNNSFISDTYFPVSGVIYMLVLVFVLNPILHLACREWKLNTRQLALVFAMLLSAAILPSQGLMRMLPWSIAQTNQQINLSPELSEAFEATGVRHGLFPDQIGYQLDTPASDQFLDVLDPDASIPWDNWLAVLAVWGVFLLACWLLMVGVGLVMLPEWREKERLPFPLIDVYRSLLPDTASGDVLPAVFRKRLFWAGAGAVMLLYALNGIAHHTHGAVPSIPMGWSLAAVFSDPPWRYLNGSIKNVGHIYFILVGMAFFMPNRVGFSIWFTTIAYGVYEMINRAYVPGYYGGTITDHRNGAMIAVSLMVLYISRRHWLQVGRMMFSRVGSDGDRLLRASGWMVAAGVIGMFAWLTWAGVPPIWSILFVFIGFMVSLLIARIVAETGMPFIRITGMNASYFMAMLPAGWVAGAAIYMAGFISLIFQLGSRVSAAVMVTHAASVDPKATPKYQLRIGYMMIGILAVGLVVCGAVHLFMGYTFDVTMDGTYSPINAWGSGTLRGSQNQLVRWFNDSWITPSHRMGNLAVGIVLAGAMQIGCMTSARFPIHPIGMLLVGHFYGQMAWASVMFGWAIKTLFVYYGGATAFRAAKPLFLGLIMGEVFSAVIWTVVPVVLLLFGHDPADVGHIPLLPR